MSQEQLQANREQIKDTIEILDSMKDVSRIFKLILKLSETYQTNPLFLVNQLLREINSDIYLIAMQFDEKSKEFNVNHLNADDEAQFFLSIIVNKGEMAHVMMLKNESDEEINAEKLHQTGILTNN